ncbi:uncharacterized protein LOC129910282, partial [Episyrphus balteatus]|uniref:uncharacterized protein LOC129910282 n=1 Tax=Episyrphus balteatus TaxID=286459 RepID=UPI00248668C9
KKKISVTDVACYWRKAPVKNMLQSEIRAIDFQKQPPSNPLPNCRPNIDDKKALEMLKSINSAYLPAAATCYDEFVLDNSETTFFLVQFYFANLFRVEYRQYSKESLLELGKNLNFSILPQSADRIEKLTRLQSQSPDNIWQKLRIGRVTASVFKEVCRTNKNIPAMSLLSKICESKTFSTAATAYGKRTEKQAVKYVEAFLRKTHLN